MKMKHFRVSVELWRETWNGYNQCDGVEYVEVDAANAASASKKAEKQVLNPGKGKAWSHARWAKNVIAEEIN